VAIRIPVFYPDRRLSSTRGGFDQTEAVVRAIDDYDEAVEEKGVAEEAGTGDVAEAGGFKED
jgi:hypothetical protein